MNLETPPSGEDRKRTPKEIMADIKRVQQPALKAQREAWDELTQKFISAEFAHVEEFLKHAYQITEEEYEEAVQWQKDGSSGVPPIGIRKMHTEVKYDRRLIALIQQYGMLMNPPRIKILKRLTGNPLPDIEEDSRKCHPAFGYHANPHKDCFLKGQWK